LRRSRPVAGQRARAESSPGARSAPAARLDRAALEVRRSAGCVHRPLAAELEAAAIELLADGLGDQDLAALRAVPDPRGDVDIDAEKVALHPAMRAPVGAGATAQP